MYEKQNEGKNKGGQGKRLDVDLEATKKVVSLLIMLP